MLKNNQLFMKVSALVMVAVGMYRDTWSSGSVRKTGSRLQETAVSAKSTAPSRICLILNILTKTINNPTPASAV